MSYLYSFCSLRHLLGVGLLAATGFRATAQTAPDTTRLSYGEEVVVAPEVDAPLRVQPEDQSLWKLGLNNFALSSGQSGGPYYLRLGGHVAYEHRIGRPGWTVMGEISPALTRYRPEPSASMQRGISLRTQVAGRYYYNLERRLRLGRNTSNFSANYVSAALGTGLGRQARATPFYSFEPNGRWVRADVAVLYGLQRRLGRYGFLDANIGVSSLLSWQDPQIAANGSFRIGFALGSSAAAYPRRVVPADTDESLQPKAYAGVQLGAYLYRVRYSEINPYRTTILPFSGRSGYGVYDRELIMPYLYAGYYLRPRLAVQLGIQRQARGYHVEGISSQGPSSRTKTDERNLALPTLLRYSLTRSFLRRVQFDAVGGLVPVWSSVRYEEQQFANGQLTDEYSFKRRTFGMHASLGLNASYGFGRRRRVQATAEWVLTKDLHNSFQGYNSLQGGASLGLRYRFGYQ